MSVAPAIGAAPAPVSFPEAQLRSQRTLGEVRARANVLADKADSAEMRAAVDRLTRFLDSGQPLKTNVPRGYYLSFTV
jgi:uncharacterized protein YceH (UPF0502 family)